MKLTSITIGVPVTSLDEASRWYEQCLELKGHIEPASDVREYEIFPGCWLQLSVADSSTSEHCLLLGVADLESDIKRVEGIIAWCDFKDPDGNNLSLYRVEQS